MRRVLTKPAGATRETGTRVIGTQALARPKNPQTIREITMPRVYGAPQGSQPRNGPEGGRPALLRNGSQGETR